MERRKLGKKVKDIQIRDDGLQKFKNMCATAVEQMIKEGIMNGRKIEMGIPEFFETGDGNLIIIGVVGPSVISCLLDKEQWRHIEK